MRPLEIMLSLLLVACGGRTPLALDDEAAAADGSPEPTAVYAYQSGICPVDLHGDLTVMEAPKGSDSFVVVQIVFGDECTGLGGQYVLGREVSGSRAYWLGGHGCQFFSPALLDDPPVYGVLRTTQTAALKQLDPALCLGFPGEPAGLSTDSSTRAVAIFGSLDEARRFAEFLP